MSVSNYPPADPSRASGNCACVSQPYVETLHWFQLPHNFSIITYFTSKNQGLYPTRIVITQVFLSDTALIGNRRNIAKIGQYLPIWFLIPSISPSFVIYYAIYLHFSRYFPLEKSNKVTKYVNKAGLILRIKNHMHRHTAPCSLSLIHI